MERDQRAATASPVHYDVPFHWWGPGWEPPVRVGLAELLRNGTLDIAHAAVLWSLLARRRSLVVIGGGSGLGKTTLLTALADLLPPATRRLHIRGCYERFTFLHDSGVDPARAALLINEISPHLPYYLWGPAVREALECRRRGFTLLATAHGETLAEFVASLTGSPLRIPAADLAALDNVAVLEPSTDTQSGRRLTELWTLSATPRGLAIDQIDAQAGLVLPENGDAVSRAETDGRTALLTALREGEITALPTLVESEVAVAAGPLPWPQTPQEHVAP